jgi:hypothetical protein
VNDKTGEHKYHPVDRYLNRSPGSETHDNAHRNHMLGVLDQLATSMANNQNVPLPISVVAELSDGLAVYLHAHGYGDNPVSTVPENLQHLADKARKHVEGGGEFFIDNALGIIALPFRGAKEKGPGEHKHRRLFMIAFYEREIAGSAKSNIQALRDAAQLTGLKGYEEQSLDREFRNWRDENTNWMMHTFDLA